MVDLEGIKKMVVMVVDVTMERRDRDPAIKMLIWTVRSTRPCPSCEKASSVLGKPYGCYQYQQKWKESQRAREALREGMV